MPAIAPPALGTVYVIQRPRPRSHDGWEPNLSPASQYGKLDFIFESSDRVYANTAAAIGKADSRLCRFNPENDFLLWPNQGDPACVWIVTMLLTSRGHNRLRFLYWSRGKSADGGGLSNEAGYYLPVDVDLSSFLAGRAKV